MHKDYTFPDLMAAEISALEARLSEVEKRDRFDVEAMVDKAVREEKWSRNRHVESVEKDLRAEFRREVMELREEMGELFVQMHETIKAVSDACDAGDNALQRVIDARTADRV